MSYSDYVEQLTYLLFLKMADERMRQAILKQAFEGRLN
jgi:type I restriction-modification system DNA methylase subunit